VNTKTLLPIIVSVLVAATLIAWLMPAGDKPRDFRIHEFGQLPVVADGRVKPFESVAREVLLGVSKKQTFTGDDKKSHSATEWLLTVMSRSPKADELKIYRIDNLDVLQMLGLEPREGFRYSLSEFREKIPALGQQAQAASAKSRNGDPMDVVERKVLELARSLSTVFQYQQAAVPLAVPPQKDQSDEWTTLAQWNRHFMESGETSPDAISLTLMLASFARGMQAEASGNADERASAVESFNKTLTDYQLRLKQSMGDNVWRSSFEAWFRAAEIFYRGVLIYLVAFLLVIAGMLFYHSDWSRPLLKAGLWVVVLTFVLHTAGLIIRMYLQGRPPVTNLYASAIFIGWGAVAVGLFIEWLFRRGMGTLVASVIGASTLLIAHLLSLDGSDTMEMQRAVLDANFWLATHVTCVTLGYTATFVAGLIGMVYILLGVFTGRLTEADDRAGQTSGGGLGKTLTQMTYGVVCFATFLSFTGTVLGGIWADQSWGRFWGWDPKENGALLIVIWNALILHARWCGMVQARGMANLAVFGNIVTAWSWFGVNNLGVGLHSYGFTEGAAGALVGFVASQLLIIALGCIPREYWRSFGEPADAKASLIRNAVTVSVVALALGSVAAVAMR
jgi:ABC-type transport system involved in cytochrome c biogenesis permease subunit